jgi:hypothetical protein
MDLGVRQIRTAGKGSGSIELTLPAEFRDLVGLPCKVTLRDGSHPDIILRPDLARVHQAFSDLWQRMVEAVLPDDPSAFPSTAFGFGLRPRIGGEEPYLCWRDGLALAGPPPHEAEALCRTLAAFGQVLAPDLGIDPLLTAQFGTACGWRLTGASCLPDAQEIQDLVSLHLAPYRPALAASDQEINEAFWETAAPQLNALADLFGDFSVNSANYARLRAAWRRGRCVELSGQ